MTIKLIYVFYHWKRLYTIAKQKLNVIFVINIHKFWNNQEIIVLLFTRFSLILPLMKWQQMLIQDYTISGLSSNTHSFIECQIATNISSVLSLDRSHIWICASTSSHFLIQKNICFFYKKLLSRMRLIWNVKYNKML